MCGERRALAGGRPPPGPFGGSSPRVGQLERLVGRLFGSATTASVLVRADGLSSGEDRPSQRVAAPRRPPSAMRSAAFGRSMRSIARALHEGSEAARVQGASGVAGSLVCV